VRSVDAKWAARPVDVCFFTLPVGSPLATEMLTCWDRWSVLQRKLVGFRAQSGGDDESLLQAARPSRFLVRCAGCHRLVVRSVLRDAMPVEEDICYSAHRR
jgi:hypothetical protein